MSKKSNEVRSIRLYIRRKSLLIDIAALVNAAAMSAIKEYITINRSEQTKSDSQPQKLETRKHETPLAISFNHFEAALKKIKRNVRVQNSGLT